MFRPLSKRDDKANLTNCLACDILFLGSGVLVGKDAEKGKAPFCGSIFVVRPSSSVWLRYRHSTYYLLKAPYFGVPIVLVASVGQILSSDSSFSSAPDIGVF